MSDEIEDYKRHGRALDSGQNFTETKQFVFWEDGEITDKIKTPCSFRVHLYERKISPDSPDYSLWTDAERSAAVAEWVEIYRKAKEERDAENKAREIEELTKNARFEEIKSRLPADDVNFIYEFAYDKGYDDGRN